MGRGERNKNNIRYWQFEGGYAQVEEAELRALLEGYRRGLFRRKPVARKALRHIACGAATTVESLLLFAYFMRRIPQRKPMQRLLAGEQYARFIYAEFQAWTGVHRASQCRKMRRLIERGFLNTIPVFKQNENVYGQLLVDGQAISLTRRNRRVRRPAEPQRPHGKKKSTPTQEKVNAKKRKSQKGNRRTGKNCLSA